MGQMRSKRRALPGGRNSRMKAIGKRSLTAKRGCEAYTSACSARYGGSVLKDPDRYGHRRFLELVVSGNSSLRSLPEMKERCERGDEEQKMFQENFDPDNAQMLIEGAAFKSCTKNIPLRSPRTAFRGSSGWATRSATRFQFATALW